MKHPVKATLLALCTFCAGGSLELSAGPHHGHGHSHGHHHNYDTGHHKRYDPAQERDEDRLRKLSLLNSVKGKEFMEEFKKQEGVIVLDSGIAYRILEKGEGPIAQKTDSVDAEFEARLISGQVFSSTAKHGKPLPLPIPELMPGLQEVLTLMPEGSRWEMVVPPGLAYGEVGRRPVIGPNATIVFDIKVVKLKAPKSQD